MKEYNYEVIDPGYYHKAMLYGNKIQRFWHSRKFSQVASLVNRKNLLVFDIGSGPGSFFYILRNKSKDSRLIGSDLVFSQVKYASDLKVNADWLVCNAVNLPIKKQNLDVVTMIEVIEHLPPELEKNIFLEIYSSLKKDGRFILTTPNYRSFWPVIEWFWNKISPVSYEAQHINKKTISSLVKDLESCGFQINYVGTFFIISPFIAFLSFELANFFMWVEQKFFPFLGSIMIVEAKK